MPVGRLVPRARQEPAIVMQAAQQFTISDTMRRYGGAADLLLVGDSLIQNWQWDDSWSLLVKDRKAINFGLGGDRIENLLWRLDQGLVDHLDVSQVVLLIGINNIWTAPSAMEVADGILRCAERVKAGLPRARLLVYGLLPLEGKVAHLDPLREEINHILEGMLAVRDFEYRYFGGCLTSTAPQTNRHFTSDGCHLLDHAYRLWAEDILEWANAQTLN